MSKTRKFLLVLLSLVCVFALAFGLSSCSSKNIPVESITLYDGSTALTSASEITMDVDDTKTISVSVSPEDATVQSWTATSSDTSAVYVNGYSGDTFTIKAKAATTSAVTITVTADDDSSVTASFKVNVTAAPEPEPTPSDVPVTGFTVDSSSATLSAGDTKTINVTASPSDATDKSFTATSSNEASVTVTVNTDGTSITVTAVASGSATITITANDGSGVSVTITITVSEPEPEPTPTPSVESVTISPAEAQSILVDGTVSFTATVTMDDGSDYTGTVTWTSSDTTVASVSEDGLVTGLKAGSTTITATADGVTSSGVAVTVSEPEPEPTPEKQVSEIVITSDGTEMTVDGEPLQFTATVYYDDGTDSTDVAVTWISSNEDVATITSEGQLVAVAAGETDITATLDGVTSNTITVTVTAAPEPEPTPTPSFSITAEPAVLDLTVGDTEDVTVTVTATDSDNTAWDYALTQSGSVVSVDKTDTSLSIEALAAGEATIVVTAEGDSEATATITITVTEAPEPTPEYELTVNPEGLNLTVGGSTGSVAVSLAATNGGSEEWDYTVYSGEDCITVDSSSDGLTITAVAEGTAVIYVYAVEDITVYKQVTVNVAAANVPVESITATPATVELTLSNENTVSTEVTITVLPTDATDKSWTAESDDDNIATAKNEDGTLVITAVGAGTTTITITAADGSDAYTTVDVTVYKAPNPIQNISIGEDLSIDVGSSKTVTVNVTPSDADDAGWKWSLSQDDVAVENGTVVTVTEGENNTLTITGISAGTVKLTVTSTADDTVTASINITVSNVLVSSITVYQNGSPLSSLTTSVVEYESITLSVVVGPENATNKNWTASATGDITITAQSVEDGTITIYGNTTGSGVLTITATDNDSDSYSVSVNISVVGVAVESVELTVDGVAITETELTVDGTDDSSITVDVSVLPETADEKTWGASISVTSGTGEVVSIDPDSDTNTLTITAVSAGVAVVTVNASGKTASITVTVNAAAVTDITVDGETTAEVDVQVDGDGATVEVAIVPEYAGNQDWGFTITEGDNLITAEQDGNNLVISAKSEVGSGTAYITVYADENREITAQITVNVLSAAVTNIYANGVEEASTEVQVGSSAEAIIYVTFGPEYTEQTGWAYTISSGDDLIDVSQDTSANTLTITAKDEVEAGEAVITVYSTVNADIKATITVTVKSAAVDSITTDAADNSVSLTLVDNATATITVTVGPSYASEDLKGWTAEITGTEGIVEINDDQDSNTLTITALAKGETEITITSTSNSDVSVVLSVSVAAKLVTSITLTDGDSTEYNDQTVDITLGDTLVVSVAANPDSATDTTWTVESSNPSIASVTDNEDGTFTITANAVSSSAVTITVTANGGESVTAVMYVNVLPVYVSSFTVTGDTSVTEYQSITLTVTVNPETATNKAWTASATGDITVEYDCDDTTGVGTITVYGAATGSGTITITASDSNGYSQDVQITVVGISVDSVTLTDENDDTVETLELIVGSDDASATLNVVVEPSNADDTSWTSSVSTDGIVTVDKDTQNNTITITAVSEGTVTVTVTASGKTAYVTVTVYEPSFTISASPESLDLVVGGEDGTVAVAVAAEHSDDESWDYTVSQDGTVINVTKTGSGLTVEAVAAGSATITVFANGDNSVSKDIAVTVVAPSFTISADPTELSLVVGEESGTVAVSVAAENSSDETWNFTITDGAGTDVENGTIVTVTQTSDGLTVEPVAVGSVTITVCANGDNSETADITVTVSNPATASLSGDTSINYPTNSTGTLTLTVENGTVDSVEWSSSVTDVATVSGGNTSATVTPALFGSTVITAKVTLESGKEIEATATVYVTNSFFYLYGVTGTWIETPYTSSDQAADAGELLEQQGSEQIYSLTLDIAPTQYGWQIAFKDISSDWDAEIKPATYYDASLSDTAYIDNKTDGFNVTEKGIYTVTLDLTDGVGKVYITESSIDVTAISLTATSSTTIDYTDTTNVEFTIAVTPDNADYTVDDFSYEVSSDNASWETYVAVTPDYAEKTITVACIADPDASFSLTLTVSLKGCSDSQSVMVESSQGGDVAVESVKFDSDSYSININNGGSAWTTTVSATAYGADGATPTDGLINYSAVDSGISISSSGVVTASGLGTFTIRATAHENEEIYVDIEVLVYSDTFYLRGSPNSWPNDVGDTVTDISSWDNFSGYIFTASADYKTFTLTVTLDAWSEFIFNCLGATAWDDGYNYNYLDTANSDTNYVVDYPDSGNYDFQVNTQGTYTFTISLASTTPVITAVKN